MRQPSVAIGLLVLLLSGRSALAQDSVALFEQKCATCHAKDGSGHTSGTSKLQVPDLRSKRIKEMSDTDIYNSIAQGTQHKEYPHAFLHIGLTEEQIRGLVKYIRALGREPHQNSTKGNAKD